MLDLIVSPIVRADWIALLFLGAILFLATEIGFRLGRRHTPERRKTHQSQSGALQGALLGLLGLLLGFTFAMAVGRYETRKQLVLDEVNAIGTTWLRADLLSETARTAIRTTLMDYAAARVEGAESSDNQARFAEQVARSERDQSTMWSIIVTETKTNNSPSSALFTSSLNDLIDLDSKRQAALRNHVPATVWILLVLVAATVSAVTGYATGLGESGRHALSMIVLPLLLTIVITIIADLDNPRRGLIQVNQQSMRDLQHALEKNR